MILFRSLDSGTFYLPSEVDEDMQQNSEYYEKWEVNNNISLTAEQICGHYGDLCEILLTTNQIKKV